MAKLKDEHPDIEYSPTESYGSLVHGLTEPPSLLTGARVQMIFFFLLSACAMTGHHYFCAFLNGRAVNTDDIDSLRISQQSVVSAVSNAIASTAAFSLASLVGVAIEQIMWYSFRHKPHSISEIDAVLKCRTSPFVPGAWSAWRTTRRLTGLAVLGAAMTLITVFAPGSLGTTTVNFMFVDTCKIPVVDLSQGSYGVGWPDPDTNRTMMYPSPSLRQLVTKVAVSSDYLRPVSPCGVCSYGLSLDGLAMQCENITDTYEFFTLMTTSVQPDELIIWNATHNLFNGSNLIVATAEGHNLNNRAVNCSIHNATYDLQVMHNGSASSVDVTNIAIKQLVHEVDTSAPDASAIRNIALATAQHLFGIGDINVNKMQDLISQYDPLSSNTFIFYESLGGPGPAQSGTWVWRDSMLNLLPELMTNISISMLSNPLGTAEKSIDTQCSYSGVVYAYKASQLFITYGIGMSLAFLCGLAGFWAISQNHAEESGRFSRLLASVLNDQMFDKPLHKGTKLKAEDTPEGFLIPVRSTL